MMSDQIRQVEDAARFLTRVLSGFSESVVYEAFKSYEHFTDEEYEAAIDTLDEFGNGSGVTELAEPYCPDCGTRGQEYNEASCCAAARTRVMGELCGRCFQPWREHWSASVHCPAGA